VFDINWRCYQLMRVDLIKHVKCSKGWSKSRLSSSKRTSPWRVVTIVASVRKIANPNGKSFRSLRPKCKPNSPALNNRRVSCSDPETRVCELKGRPIALNPR
jgi:hypothetical protein